MDDNNKPIKLKGQVSLHRVESCTTGYPNSSSLDDPSMPCISLETRDKMNNEAEITFRFLPDINPVGLDEEAKQELLDKLYSKTNLFSLYVQAVGKDRVLQQTILNNMMITMGTDSQIDLVVDKKSILPFVLASGFNESQFEDIFHIQYMNALLNHLQHFIKTNPGLLERWKKAWRKFNIIILIPSEDEPSTMPPVGSLYQTRFDDYGNLLIKFTPNMCCTNVTELGSDLLSNTEKVSYYDNLIREERIKRNKADAEHRERYRQQQDSKNLARIADAVSRR